MSGGTFMGVARRRVAGVVLAATLALSACSGVPGLSPKPEAAPSVPLVRVPKDAATSASPSPTEPATPSRNDLKSGSITRTIRVPGVTTRVTYSTPLEVASWTPEVSKPVNVSLTAVRGSKRDQKIYLTRVRADVGVSDGSGSLEGPAPLSDEASISPGFIVTSPFTYGQVFVIPAVDGGGQSLTIDFTYEFLLLVSSRDYAKQTARDSITVPLA